jgi:acetyl esterase/lipase
MTLEFDPEVADVLAQLGGTTAFQPPRDDVEGRRAFWEPILAASSAAQPFPDDVEMSDRYATADDGAQIQMRWYTKEGATPGPAVVYFHGGGYFFGHIDHFDGTVARYVSASGVPMLSVEYRRAPEHPLPTPVEDGYAALNWLYEHAAELGVDPDRIGVMGDSAGGGMAAAVSILARERGGPQIARQILVMPMLDDRTTPDPHLAPFTYNYGDLVTGWQAFLGDAVGSSDVPARLRPRGSRRQPASRRPTSRSASLTCSATKTPPTPQNSAGPACRWSSTCTPAYRTSSTPSPSPPTSRGVPSPIASGCSSRYEQAPNVLAAPQGVVDCAPNLC